MKKRNFIIVLLISISTLSLVGCGSSKKQEAPAQQTQQTTTTKDEASSKDLDKDIKATAEQTAKDGQKQDVKTATDTKPTTGSAEANKEEKLISQEDGVEILKNGYITGGVDIAYQNVDTIDNHKLLKYYTMHTNEQGSTVIDTVLYVDGQTKKVYHHNNSGVLVETILKK
jgi:hypothetical protein